LRVCWRHGHDGPRRRRVRTVKRKRCRRQVIAGRGRCIRPADWERSDAGRRSRESAGSGEFYLLTIHSGINLNRLELPIVSAAPAGESQASYGHKKHNCAYFVHGEPPGKHGVTVSWDPPRRENYSSTRQGPSVIRSVGSALLLIFPQTRTMHGTPGSRPAFEPNLGEEMFSGHCGLKPRGLCFLLCPRVCSVFRNLASRTLSRSVAIGVNHCSRLPSCSITLFALWKACDGTSRCAFTDTL